jgi:hypothetical protein
MVVVIGAVVVIVPVAEASVAVVCPVAAGRAVAAADGLLSVALPPAPAAGSVSGVTVLAGVVTTVTAGRAVGPHPARLTAHAASRPANAQLVKDSLIGHSPAT